MRRFTSRLLVVSLLVGVLSASAAMAADNNDASDPGIWAQFVSWTTASGDTLSFDDWVILMGRLGVPPG